MLISLLNKLKKEFDEKQSKIDSLTTVIKKLSWNRFDRYKGVMGTDIVIGTDPSQNKQLQIEHEHLLNNRYQEYFNIIIF